MIELQWVRWAIEARRWWSIKAQIMENRDERKVYILIQPSSLQHKIIDNLTLFQLSTMEENND